MYFEQVHIYFLWPDRDEGVPVDKNMIKCTLQLGEKKLNCIHKLMRPHLKEKKKDFTHRFKAMTQQIRATTPPLPVPAMYQHRRTPALYKTWVYTSVSLAAVWRFSSCHLSWGQHCNSAFTQQCRTSCTVFSPPAVLPSLQLYNQIALLIRGCNDGEADVALAADDFERNRCLVWWQQRCIPSCA